MDQTPNETFAVLAPEQRIAKVIEALEANSITADVAESAEEAKAKALALIPAGAQVFTLQSMTLKESGITAAIDESGKYDSVRNKLGSMDNTTQADEKRRLGSAPDYAIGSVHAITEDGVILIASNTGSQLAADASGAGKVIWVVGAHKLVKDLEEGMKRIYEYTLPLESERLGQSYPGMSSFVSKLLIVNREAAKDRAHVIIVKAKLGF